MSLMLRKQRGGGLRPYWYGEYTDHCGKRKVVNLNVRWKGVPPASLRQKGDSDFEVSRTKAEIALAVHTAEEGRKGRAEHLTERLIEAKTGKAVEYVRLNELSVRWRGLGRETPASEAYLKGCDAAFKRFAGFMLTRDAEMAYLYQVTPQDAGAYMTAMQKAFARKTVRDHAKLLNKAFERFLPVGAANPFAGFVGRRAAGESEMVHRKPFSDLELKALLDAARGDEFMYPLIVTAACTGMRRGDVCGLRWSAVDLDNGMLTVKTSKTGASVEIPIFKPLLAVLKARQHNGRDLVFPEAAELLERNPDSLTWQFKKIVARAFAEGEKQKEVVEEPVPASEVRAQGEAAIVANIGEGPRRDRILDVFRRYCDGQSVRQIVAASGHAKCTVSYDLHEVQDMIGKKFLRTQQKSIKKDIRSMTQVKRRKGQRAASIRDWHALRATFVTLALSAGVPVELVRRVTGHATVEVVLKHYFRPDREQFKAALVGAMPKVLTGKKARVKPAEELAALAAKLAAGKASDADKERLRKLAAKV
ncbi:MAG: tyrosine-type recombinase/integrase [Kiritimatiellae bacterium]|nr:tyrosine-type recombinase/integrase [Kiritimatiellia bacterium]